MIYSSVKERFFCFVVIKQNGNKQLTNATLVTTLGVWDLCC